MNFTSTFPKQLPGSVLILTMIFLFSFESKAYELELDLNFFYAAGPVSSATEPGLRCNDLVPNGLILMLDPNSSGVVLDSDNFHSGDPDCDFGFAIPPNDSTFETSLTFSDPGTYNAFFYVLGPVANATPMGPCPFDISISEMAFVSTDETRLENISVYPNPAKTSLKLDFPDYHFLNLELYNSNGALVRKESTEVQSLDVSDLANGVYFLKIYFEEGITERKIVKE